MRRLRTHVQEGMAINAIRKPQRRMYWMLGLFIAASSAMHGLGASPPTPPGTTSVKIDIPHTDSITSTPIGTVVATVSFASTATQKITITDPQGSVWTVPDLPTGNASSCNSTNFPSSVPPPTNAVACHQFPAPPGTCSLCKDEVVIVPAPPISGFSFSQYKIQFSLYSNFDRNSSCNPTVSSAGTDNFTITVTSGPNITGVCLETYDLVTALCSAQVVTSAPLAGGAFLDGQSPATEKCFKARPPLDVMVVLDKSGSMESPPLGTRGTCGTTPLTKIAALREALTDFANVWNELRVSELPSNQTDKVGAVLFSTGASDWTPGTLAAGLNQFATATSGSPAAFPVSVITSNVGSITADGSTTIGGGLSLAAGHLPSVQSGRREVLLLMSDGKQNNGRGAGTNPATNKTATYPDVNSTACTSANPCTDLAYPVYTVTVGTSTAVDPGIMRDIASHSGGFYINTEDNACLLRPFFLEMLQNFLWFNTYETLRMTSSATPFTSTMPVAATSRDVEFHVMWQPEFGGMRLTVTPPGGAASVVQENASGFLSVVLSLPITGAFDPLGDWKVQVDSLGSVEATRGSTSVPFDLQVMADDGAIKSDLSVVPADYKAGDKVLLRAKLTQFGRPILGLGSHPGDVIGAEPVEPGQSIGDMLSESTASPDPPVGSTDLVRSAEAKLFNTLQQTPEKLIRRKAPSIQLFDDGRPEHGDDVANDGIYSALYPAALPGHYNFLIVAEGVDKSAVRFSRQQLRTTFVRAVPDASHMEFQSSIAGRGRDHTLSIVMTPRGKAGDRLGPGWANYFWFTAPGVTPFKAVDNFDGTYTAKLPFSGANPPGVQVHFESVVALIGDSVTDTQLPQPLGPGNVVTSVPPVSRGIAVFLDMGAGIPVSTFAGAFSTGFSLDTGLEYALSSHFSVEGVFGYHRFPAKAGGSEFGLYQFGGSGKIYPASVAGLHPFMEAGVGGYKFSSAGTYFGGNVGAGLLHTLTPHWGLQGSYQFHAVNTTGGATQFSVVQGGIRFAF